MNKELKCPKCNCTDIVVTIQHRKATIWKLLKFVCIIALFLITIFYIAEIIEYSEEKITGQALTQNVLTAGVIDTPTTGSNEPFAVADTYVAMPNIIGFTVLTIFFEIIQLYTESKTRIYYVCKDCSEIWYKKEE